ncbi:MAG: CoA pyrophosphatase [Ferrimonas sp.]
MTPDTLDFLQRFSLQPLPQLPSAYPPITFKAPVRHAAVLLALEPSPNGLQLLLTQRSAQMPTHPGEIAFPGGKVEADDQSPWHAAAREAWEEIGLPTSHLQQVGQLSALHTRTGFYVFPFVALITKPFQPIVSKREVERLFRVPLLDFSDHQRRRRITIKRRQQWHPIYLMHHNIWGATAAIIEQLMQLLGYQAAREHPEPSRFSLAAHGNHKRVIGASE